jgi:N6-L-threonylcarbamoyladenine synthase
MYSSGMLSGYKGGRFIAFHVSGGTTEMLLCEKTADGITADIIGQTLDLNAGQAVDRTGVMLGLSFPCGMHVERLALDYYATHGRICGFGVSVKGLDCCLSGVENKVQKAYSETKDAGYVAAFVLEYIAKTLIKMTDAAISEYGKLPLLYAGGVMSNGIIKQRIKQKYADAFFAAPEYSSDNASGSALLALEKYLHGNA